MNCKLFIIPLVAVAVLFSCKKEEKPAPKPPSTKAVLVGNEGLFAGGAGDITEYNPLDKTENYNAFQKANTYPMGNSLNSMYVDGDRIFLVLNGSSEIVVVNKSDYKVVKRFKNLGAPRYIMKVAENKYYVTDWQQEGVLVLSYVNGNVYRKIKTGKGPERMVLIDNMAFVANSGGGDLDSTVTVINTDVDTVMAQLPVGINPNSLQIDQNDKLWVLCSGEKKQNTALSRSGNLISFDLSVDSLFYGLDTLKMVDSLTFADNQMRPKNLEQSPEGDLLYFLDNANAANLMRFNITSKAAPSTPYISGTFYGLGIDPIEHEIYLSDANDFTQNGEVYRYDKNGAQMDQFKVGLIPGSFGFK